MVQSSRLKKTPSPLTPFYLLPVILVLLIIFGSKIFETYFSSQFLSYQTYRNMKLLEINKETDTLTSHLNDKISNRQLLLETFQTAQSSASNLITLYDNLIIKENTLQKSIFLSKYSNIIEDNYLIDTENRKKVFEIVEILDNKILAISQYQLLKDVDNCIKKINSSTSQKKCLVLFNQTAELESFNPLLYNQYEEIVVPVINNYLSYSKANRTKKVNDIVEIQNKFTDILEEVINEKID